MDSITSRFLIVFFFSITLSSVIPAQSSITGAVAAPFEHVVVIGVDGMSPDGIRRAATPNIDDLVANGAATFRARGVLPTSSSPNWASMITGAGPERHGVTSNAWEKNDFILPVAAADTDGYFPSIFNLIHDQKPGAKSAAIYHWEGFGRLFNSKLVNLSVSPKTEEETTTKAVSYLRENRPLFCFVHLDHVDGAGHSQGHGSPAYYQAVSKADSLIGILLGSLRETGMLENTLIILSSDHGGLGFGHGGESPEELEIPFILYGKGIKAGYEIQGAVSTIDNAATAAFALGLELPDAWTGRPITEAFQGYAPPSVTYPVPKVVPPPIIHPKKIGFEPAGGLFIDQQAELRIDNPNPDGVIRYTLNGELPTETAPVYTGPLTLQANTVVRAAIFESQKKISRDAVAYFRILASHPDQGVQYRAFPVDGISKLPDLLSDLPAETQGVTREIMLNEVDLPRTEQVAVEFQTHLKIGATGTYQFYLASDDGSKLWVNDQLVVDNDGDHGVIEKSGKIELKPGKQSLKVQWFNGGGGGELFLYYRGPDIPKQLVPASVLFLPKSE